MSKTYIVKTKSTHVIQYAVETEEKDWKKIRQNVEDRISNGTIDDFAQKWMGEKIEKIVEVEEDAFVRAFDNANRHQKTWNISSKLDLINNIDVEVKEMIESNNDEIL